MEQPTEPGFYWAKMAAWCEAGSSESEWEPVKLMDYGGTRIVVLHGDEQDIEPGDVAEWGPRIEPPGSWDDETTRRGKHSAPR